MPAGSEGRSTAEGPGREEAANGRAAGSRASGSREDRAPSHSPSGLPPPARSQHLRASQL